MSKNQPDKKIIQSVLNGKKEDFGILVDKYQGRIFAMVARRIPQNDVEDVAQDIFLRIFRGLPGYAGKKSFENWLSVIALRSCYDYWRKKGKCKEDTAPAAIDEEASNWLDKISSKVSRDVFLSASRRHEASELLDRTLDKLSAEDKTLIEMVYFEGRSLKEASDVLNWKRSKTKVRIMRAKIKLRKIISELSQGRMI
jgi:RNA polymerase sigma-70 factor (ECF subfamily)